jgi:hypothetical protein
VVAIGQRGLAGLAVLPHPCPPPAVKRIFGRRRSLSFLKSVESGGQMWYSRIVLKIVSYNEECAPNEQGMKYSGTTKKLHLIGSAT